MEKADPVRIELPYLGAQSWYALLRHHHVVFEACETYQKRSFRNRTLLVGASGKVMLSVPLQQGKHEQMPIRQVRIAYMEDWRRSHLRTIRTCYQSAPFFDHYFPAWEHLYAQSYEYLWDLNWHCTWLACTQLGITVQASSSTVFGQDYRWDLLGKITPKNHHEFACKPYQQLFEDRQPFVKNVSILDLIFCCGPSAKGLLEWSDSNTVYLPRS
ncbi:MAG: WbqC family protein [Saprospiraceae bacterium]|nr:WbqC family protein [Saprospiraceae bacterium]